MKVHVIKVKFSSMDFEFMQIDYMGLNARKPVFEGLRTTKAQTDLRHCYLLNGKYQI